MTKVEKVSVTAGTPETRLDALEAWARQPHTTPFGVVAVPEKVTAFYTRPDGKIEKHEMFLMDYTAAEKHAPDVWTLDVPGPGVEVIDKTSVGQQHAPVEKKEPLTELPAMPAPAKPAHK